MSDVVRCWLWAFFCLFVCMPHPVTLIPPDAMCVMRGWCGVVRFCIRAVEFIWHAHCCKYVTKFLLFRDSSSGSCRACTGAFPATFDAYFIDLVGFILCRVMTSRLGGSAMMSTKNDDDRYFSQTTQTTPKQAPFPSTTHQHSTVVHPAHHVHRAHPHVQGRSHSTCSP